MLDVFFLLIGLPDSKNKLKLVGIPGKFVHFHTFTAKRPDFSIVELWMQLTDKLKPQHILGFVVDSRELSIEVDWLRV